MLWTIGCGGNKTINLLSKNSVFSLECFLEDYKDPNKKFNEWTKVAETLQSEIAQVMVTFSGLQRTRNSSMRKQQERHIGIFFYFKKRLSLLHAQVNDKCPGFSRSRLKRNCPQSGLRSMMLSLFSRSSIRRLLVLLINCQNQEIEKFLEELCLI